MSRSVTSHNVPTTEGLHRENRMYSQLSQEGHF